MVDPHVHLRDWNQKNKETLKHGLSVAYQAGLDGVFEMPNTDPPLISKQSIQNRIDLVNALQIPIWHGLFTGLTSNPHQIEEIIKVYAKTFPRTVGLKLYAGESTGTLGITSLEEQKKIIKIITQLGYTGVLAVHCEKIDLFNKDLWSPDNPFSHTQARPPGSELVSITEIIQTADQYHFQGVLHICHISTPESVAFIENARKAVNFKITCGITPHHALLFDTMMKLPDGYLLKMNPPLRTEESQKTMFDLLLQGKIDWIETDHAPHRKSEKKLASGIPGFPFYPQFIKILRKKGISEERLEEITHTNIISTFKINIPNLKRKGALNLSSEYEFDPYQILKSGD